MATKLFDVNGPSLKFTRDELFNEHATISLDPHQQLNIIHHANSNLELLGNQGFLKFKLNGFIPVEQKVEELKNVFVGSRVDGNQIRLGKYYAYRTSAQHELINLRKWEIQRKQPLSFFANENIKAIGLKNWKGNGPELLENIFNLLRGNTTRLVSYYAHAYGHLDYGLEGQTGFDISNLGTPIIEIFGEKYPGFSDGVITYIGPTGSVFGLHTDDADTNAANLNLGGGTKTWIIAHKSYKPRIHELVSQWERVKGLKEIRSTQQNCLIDPLLYRDNNIPFKVVEQFPGEILFTGRSVFHQGVNLAKNDGFVVNIACNVLLDDFLLEYEEFRYNINLKDKRLDKIQPDLNKVAENVKDYVIKAKLKDKDPISCVLQVDSSDGPKAGVSTRKNSKTTSLFTHSGPPLETSDKGQYTPTVSTRQKTRKPLVKTASKASKLHQTSKKGPSPSLKMKLKRDDNKSYKTLNAQLKQELNQKNELIKSLQDRIRGYERKPRRNRHDSSQGTSSSSAGSTQRKPNKVGVQKSGSKKLTIYDEEPDLSVLKTNIKNCPKCQKCFPQKYKLKEHYLNHFLKYRNRIKCPECPKLFCYKPALTTHVMREHRGKKEIHICHGCGRRYEWISKLKEHYAKSPDCNAN